MSTKEKVLSLINSSSFISGEALAEKCQVSRAAIHKTISVLRNQGYSIEAVTNKGYKLLSHPDSLDAQKIECGCQVKVFDSLDSTMLEAKRLTADQKLSKFLIVTDQQTAGRGRMGRPFVSPKGTGVYFSLIYSPENGVKNPAIFTAAAAVSVARAVSSLYGEECSIKWVNDVFLNKKKICGILTEGIANFETGRIETAIVGIGINVRNCNFSGELAEVAGSIEELTANKNHQEVSRNSLVATVISDLVKIYDAYEKGQNEEEVQNMLKEYKDRSLLIGTEVMVHPTAGIEGDAYKAKVLDISDEAELVVELEDGTVKKLFSGEVSLKSSLFTSRN